MKLWKNGKSKAFFSGFENQNMPYIEDCVWLNLWKFKIGIFPCGVWGWVWTKETKRLFIFGLQLTIHTKY